MKFQETLKVPTVYYESEEFIHGPDMQLTPDYSVFFIDCGKTSDRLYDIYKATLLITEHCYMITDQVHDKRDGQIRYHAGFRQRSHRYIQLHCFNI